MSKVRAAKLMKGGKPPDSVASDDTGRKKSTAPTIIKAKDPNDKGTPSPATQAAIGRKAPDEKKKKDAAKPKPGAGGNKPTLARESRDNQRKKAAGKDTPQRVVKPKQKRTAFDKLLIFLGMGSGNGAVLRDPRTIEAANALGLRPWHIRRLKAKFDEIDIDGSGNIDSDEFFEAIGEQRSPFTDKLFALIDLDGSGTIEFDEYVRVLATYCMYSKDDILRFCFECFDVDGSGTIDEKEFIELCKTVNNAAPQFPANFKTALESFDVNQDGLIDYGEFIEIDRRFPIVLFPAFRLQDYMQRSSLGEMAWTRVMEEYARRKYIEEHKATHGGRMPPDPPLTALGKLVCPCFFRERAYVKLGVEMENKHRAEQGKGPKKK